MLGLENQEKFKQQLVTISLYYKYLLHWHIVAGQWQQEELGGWLVHGTAPPDPAGVQGWLLCSDSAHGHSSTGEELPAPLGSLERQEGWMGKSHGGWSCVFLLKPFYGFSHPVLLGVSTNLITIASHNPAMRK